MLIIFVTFQVRFSLWILLGYLMADVIGLGHGGDGAGNDPPGGGGFDQHGHHEQDGKSINKFYYHFYFIYHRYCD